MWLLIKKFFERLSRKKRKKQIFNMDAEQRKNLLELGNRYNFDPVKEEEKFKNQWTKIIKQEEIKNKKKL
jgi:hypothetical protein